jgi:putative aldouronate transport system substrate-binding protein
MKKTLTLVLALLLALASLTYAAAEPFGEGKTLSFSCLEGWYSAVTINDNLPSWQKIEENTGVKIEWEAISDYDTAMQPRVAAGQELPDIMLIPPSWGNSGVYKMALDGTIIPIDDLLAQYAPNITKILEENPALKGLITAPDGHIYTICDAPMFVNDLVVQNALFIREDWLKALGLETPETIEDWYAVLTAFKDYDATGYGIPAVPFGGNGSLYSKLNVFTCAYGLPASTGYWWYDEDGNVFLTYATEAFREYLTEMNKWYTEGLVDVEMRDESNFQSLVATDVVGAFSTLSERVKQYDGLLSTAGATGNHILTAPPASGDKLLTKRPGTWNHYGITKYCEDPELAIRWIDYVWGSDEGVTINEWGIEGLSFAYDEAGQKYYTDYVLNNPDGLDPYNALRSLGSSDTILVRTPAEVYAALNTDYVIEYGEALLDQRVEPFPQVMATEEEQEILDRIQPDFQTYCDESVEKFITGITPMSEFDAFVEKLNEIGLQELLAVKQAQFDRSGVR